MLKAQKEDGLMAKPSGSNQHKDRSQGDTDPPTLADIGISKTLSSRSQKIAELPEKNLKKYLNHIEALKSLFLASLSLAYPTRLKSRNM